MLDKKKRADELTEQIYAAYGSGTGVLFGIPSDLKHAVKTVVECVISLENKEASLENKPKLKLLGNDGNAFVILGLAHRVAKENDMDWDKIRAEVKSGDYDHLLRTMMKYFEVE